jgi:uncharacterized membrane protein HdeD (DUF308 family)
MIGKWADRLIWLAVIAIGVTVVVGRLTTEYPTDAPVWHDITVLGLEVVFLVSLCLRFATGGRWPGWWLIIGIELVVMSVVLVAAPSHRAWPDWLNAAATLVAGLWWVAMWRRKQQLRRLTARADAALAAYYARRLLSPGQWGDR